MPTNVPEVMDCHLWKAYELNMYGTVNLFKEINTVLIPIMPLALLHFTTDFTSEFSGLSLVFLLISSLTNWLHLHQFLGTKTTDANKSLKADANRAHY